MQHKRLACVFFALAIAGCGSSGSSTSRSASASAPSQASAPSPSTSAAITTKHDKLGTILAYGPKRLTVYMFAADRGPSSTCSGACAGVWPPVAGKPSATGGASSAHLGTITRADGTTQVTYNGHPLYLYVKDKDDGDAYGQAIKSFGADWYVLSPSGNKIDNS